MGFILGCLSLVKNKTSPKQAAHYPVWRSSLAIPLAAVGPVLIGALYDWQGSLASALYVILMICITG